MPDLELEGERWILAVAQTPFQTSSNEFATLAPVVSEDGERARPVNFRNYGLVWWMLRPGYGGWAQPGRLLVAGLEESAAYAEGDRTKHDYQVRIDGIRPLGPRDGLEVITVHDPAVRTPAALIDRPGVLHLDHIPSEEVWVRLGSHLHGPFRTAHTERPDRGFDIELRLPANDPVVTRVDDSALRRLGASYAGAATTEISENSNPVYDTASAPVSITYELVIGGEANRKLRQLGEPITIESDERRIARIAKQVMPRTRRQELVRLLEELRDLAASSAEVAPEDEAVVLAIQNRVKENSAAIETLVERILGTGVLDGKIENAIEARFRMEVERRSGYLTAEAESASAEARERLTSLCEDERRIEEELARKRETAEQTFQAEIADRRRRMDEVHGLRAKELDEREGHLDEREDRLRASLEMAALRLVEKREEVVADLLTILPLVNGVAKPSGGAAPSVIAGAARGADGPPAPDAEVGIPTDHRPLREESTFAMPPWLRTERAENEPLTEPEFFERVRRRVQDAGFTYDIEDLLALHLSFKSSDLTLLSGVSGTGKSSLPRFYAEALQGNAAAELDGEIGRYLHVAVRPSWLDQQDLLGHLNTLDREFVPSESGLFRLLATAAEENARRGPGSGFWIVCLDEMNLAQVEHYFGSFLSALERPIAERTIRCFDVASVAGSSPFRQWAQLSIPETIHFVGTVNYDETTRPLSLRFLDRTDEIELRTRDFRDLRSVAAAGIPDRSTVKGRPVTLSDLRAWSPESRLSPDLASVLDTMRAPLQRMRRPLTPRRFTALTRFVGAAAGLRDFTTEDRAFDLHLTLRMVPQFRSLGSAESLQGLSDLRAAFDSEGYAKRFPRTWASLQEIDASLRPILEF